MSNHIFNRLENDDIKFLKNISKQLKTQDRKATAKPIYYQIREFKNEYGYDTDYSHNVCLMIGDEFTPAHTVEEAKELIIGYYDPKNNSLNHLKECNFLGSIKTWCENRDINCVLTGYKEKHKDENIFLTKKAIDEHIKQNYHHYEQGEDTMRYIKHGWRNPELKRLLAIIEKLTE